MSEGTEKEDRRARKKEKKPNVGGKDGTGDTANVLS